MPMQKPARNTNMNKDCSPPHVRSDVGPCPGQRVVDSSSCCCVHGETPPHPAAWQQLSVVDKLLHVGGNYFIIMATVSPSWLHA
eukprot:3468578-Amphidinium_carterae.1